MKISAGKKTCLIISCLLVFLTCYGALMKDIFWDVFLFRNISFYQEITYEFDPSVEVFALVQDAGKNISVEKLTSNTGAIEIWTRYQLRKKQVILSSPNSMFVDFSRTRLYRTEDSEKRILNREELIDFLSLLAEKHLPISVDSFSWKRVMLDRDFYDVYYLHSDISGEIYTYGFLGREEEYRMPAISAEQTTLKKEAYKKSFSVKAFLISAAAAILVAAGGYALAGKLSNRKYLVFTIVLAVISVSVSVVSILLRR